MLNAMCVDICRAIEVAARIKDGLQCSEVHSLLHVGENEKLIGKPYKILFSDKTPNPQE